MELQCAGRELSSCHLWGWTCEVREGVHRAQRFSWSVPCWKADRSFFCCCRVHRWLLQSPVLSTMHLPAISYCPGCVSSMGFHLEHCSAKSFSHHPLRNCGVWLEWDSACFADGWFREDNLADKHRVFHLLTKHLLGFCALCLVWKVPVVILVASPACVWLAALPTGALLLWE